MCMYVCMYVYVCVCMCMYVGEYYWMDVFDMCIYVEVFVCVCMWMWDVIKKEWDNLTAADIASYYAGMHGRILGAIETHGKKISH